MTRYFLVFSFLVIIFGAIIAIFWREEIRYSLPTPVPTRYNPVSVKSKIDFANRDIPSSTALYLHFYNPDCPCSRFNAKHIRELIRSHGDSISAFIVVPTKDAIEGAQSEFGDALKIITDQDGNIATACGVYSTPQAVIVDQNGKLFFRGNYNRSRYCTAKATNYAELALVSLLNGAEPPVFDLFATQSYGCSLPSESNIASFIQP